MKWIIILFLVAGGISVFIYVLALFRWFQIKWYFQNTLPYSEQECIKGFPRYPLWYYKMRSTPWNDRIAKDLVKRNQILMEYDEILRQFFNPQFAETVIETIIKNPNTQFFTPHYHFNLIIICKS